jgi:AAA15 family ATPase/GTPase
MHVKAVNFVNKRKFQSAIVPWQIDLVLSRVEVHFVMDFNIWTITVNLSCNSRTGDHVSHDAVDCKNEHFITNHNNYMFCDNSHLFKQLNTISYSST